MINLDMVGRLDNGSLELGGVGSAKEFLDLARRVQARTSNTAALDLDLALLDSLDLGPDLLRIAVGVGGDGFHHLELDIAAQLDVGAAAGHVRGDGHGADLARAGDDLGLVLVVLVYTIT